MMLHAEVENVTISTGDYMFPRHAMLGVRLLPATGPVNTTRASYRRLQKGFNMNG